MAKIKNINAREILDSRGNPTVRAIVTLAGGVTGEASVPSGASTGVHEALELRDGDRQRYGGKGVLKAVRNVNVKISRALKGKDASQQRQLDELMIKLDGTENKRRLGANAILAVSLALARAGAKEAGQPLYRYLRRTYRLAYRGWRLPYPMMNIVNGGVHADSGLSVQEFMVVPRAKMFKERVRQGAEVFYALKGLLKARGYLTLVGDEGGFAPPLGQNEKAIGLIMAAIKAAGYRPGQDVEIASDFAASEFYRRNHYFFTSSKTGWDAERMIKEVTRWQKKYPLISVEDPLDQDDWENWRKITAKLGKKILLVGDDLFVTNIKRLERGIKNKIGNAILIKLNQIGSLSETVDCVKLAQKRKYQVIISHRSGETGDTFIADLAVAVNADYIKTGSLSRSERVEKYNRLMEIEQTISV